MRHALLKQALVTKLRVQCGIRVQREQRNECKAEKERDAETLRHFGQGLVVWGTEGCVSNATLTMK